MLSIKDLNTYYGNIHALKGINMEIEQGEIVSLIGSNGAGKTTTLGSIAGLIPARSGSVIFKGQDITNVPAHNLVKLGISLSPEGREVFPALSVQENLRLGAYIKTDKAKIKESFERVYDLFPRLRERINQSAGTLSGGEQQMLAIGRALMCEPELLLLDEPSLGLAPNLVLMIFELIESINKKHGTTILLIEQNANMALSISHRAYVLETGRISMFGKACDLANDPRVKKAYLGQM
ncbi:branched-chain amino acid transport system ATP-binding protein [Hydrogenoanaerobacterium saccharovorans]|uniref:Branched-chain amino acid transport system ATP-binding protein n=1 Tax=Hydrogenoanaerobacterium saccharovorans TaxID=474960 RepID=A0A1H8CQE5_9FIRM|nr:ABC transporter ATP-binding protein [Hydrogenoanaerobacterium saccharovorans]RPF43215.1 branched-chain amino acid transport system ATP-binding protein [Hydrogenoanaerobacterium saccharovorans]SEM96337.1 branched-chain amino acid transport system ATP-binding protein [Hydrogenoanaerobacterium saccharovorans]